MATHSQLSPQLMVPDRSHECSDAAKIVAEIAERLIELAETTGEAKAQRWVMKLASLFSCSQPRAGWLYLRISTGDLSEVTNSHSDNAEKMHRSKQGEHKEFVSALAAIKRQFPELEKSILQITRPNAVCDTPRAISP